MAYIVLARKLRPTRFEDLVGQETISHILKNAILANRVAHAFIFTGSRGTGKTSTARILTKALNCLNLQNGDPCNACLNCQEINDNSSPDVYEIDAASNRGIENIRELRENTKYSPAHCRYKIYIIDEAHMLTLESFNALLKTLEEPPAHVKFILATTDPHKVPQTIISRCQRFDFLRIPLIKMADYLAKIAIQENIQISRHALEQISRHSVGGMRDALTALDQVISFTGQQIQDQDVQQILGMMDSQAKFRLLSALLIKNPAAALHEFQEMIAHGQDIQDLLGDLLTSFKTLALFQTFAIRKITLPLSLKQDLVQQELEFYQSSHSILSEDELQRIFDLLLQLEEQMKRSAYALLCFEMTLLQITSLYPLTGLSELLAKIQNSTGGGSGTPRKPPMHSSPTHSSLSLPPTSTTQQNTAGLSQPQNTNTAMANPNRVKNIDNLLSPSPTTVTNSRVSANFSASLADSVKTAAIDTPAETLTVVPQQNTLADSTQSGHTTEHNTAPVIKPEELSPARLGTEDENDEEDEYTLKEHPLSIENRAAIPYPLGTRNSADPDSNSAAGIDSNFNSNQSFNSSRDMQQWTKFVEDLRSKSPRLAGLLNNTALLSNERGVLVIGFKEALLLEQMNDNLKSTILQQAQITWPATRQIQYQMFTSQHVAGVMTLSEKDQKEVQALIQQRKDEAQQHPQVVAIVNAFPQSQIKNIEVLDFKSRN